MIVVLQVSAFPLFCLFRRNSSIDNTKDVLENEFYDCVRVCSSSLNYCRRPKEAISLSRDNDTTKCEHNGGEQNHFGELQSKNISLP